jgi:hypothetical protein
MRWTREKFLSVLGMEPYPTTFKSALPYQAVNDVDVVNVRNVTYHMASHRGSNLSAATTSYKALKPSHA